MSKLLLFVDYTFERSRLMAVFARIGDTSNIPELRQLSLLPKEHPFSKYLSASSGSACTFFSLTPVNAKLPYSRHDFAKPYSSQLTLYNLTAFWRSFSLVFKNSASKWQSENPIFNQKFHWISVTHKWNYLRDSFWNNTPHGTPSLSLGLAISYWKYLQFDWKTTNAEVMVFNIWQVQFTFYFDVLYKRSVWVWTCIRESEPV